MRKEDAQSSHKGLAPLDLRGVRCVTKHERMIRYTSYPHRYLRVMSLRLTIRVALSVIFTWRAWRRRIRSKGT